VTEISVDRFDDCVGSVVMIEKAGGRDVGHLLAAASIAGPWPPDPGEEKKKEVLLSARRISRPTAPFGGLLSGSEKVVGREGPERATCLAVNQSRTRWFFRLRVVP